MDMFDIEELLRDQAYRIRAQYPMEFALDLMEVMHTDDIRAFHRHPSRRTTRAYEDSNETRWNGHSHFQVGKSSEIANDPDEIQITTGHPTRMEQADPQESP
nr:hypothetical protein CFP56_05110 [Quercus suber]